MSVKVYNEGIFGKKSKKNSKSSGKFKIMDRKTGYIDNKEFDSERDALDKIKKLPGSEHGRYKVVKAENYKVTENVSSKFDRDIAEDAIGQFIADNFLPENGLEGKENVKFSEAMYELMDIIEAANLRAISRKS